MKLDEVSVAEEYLRTRVSDLVEAMTVDILISRPNNVVDFMVAWLEESGEKYDCCGEKKLTRRPSGIETSGEEEDEVMDELPLPTPEQAERGRNSVSAEVLSAAKSSFVPRVVPKEAAEKERIARLLKSMLLFSSLDARSVAVVVDAMEVKRVEAEETVITQGDRGMELFVVNAGRLNCFKQGETGERVHLRQYGPGEYFGELALLYNTPRAATIVAIEPSELLSLDRLTFNNIVKQAMIENITKFEGFLEHVPLLAQLSSYERGRLADSLAVREFSPGEYVIREGESGDALFFVIEGTAVALKRRPDSGQEVEVMTYHENSYFGELALLRNEPRAASVKAVDHLKCATVNRNAFKRMLGPLEAIMRRNAEQYVKF